MRDYSIHKSFLQGALILTFAGIIAKVMGALYRIPFQNIAGDVGYYVYQQVYPFYGTIFSLSMYGFPVIISKLIADSKSSVAKYNEREIITVSSIVLGILFFGLFFIVYYGSPYIAEFMRDPLLVPAIKAVSFSFLVLPIVSVLRGMYQGNETMLPTGVSQVIEQSIRVIFILSVSFIIAGNNGSVYDIGSTAAFGGVVGGIFASLLLFAFLRRYKMNITSKLRLSLKKVLSITKHLLMDGIAISLSASLLILFQFIDAFEIPYVLTSENVFTEVIKKQKGIFDRGQPLLNLGIVIATSISLSLVPYISTAFSKKNWKTIARSSATALKLGLVLGGAATVGLVIIIAPTNIMLFENQAGSDVLGVLGISILFATIALIAAGIIQGIGKSQVVTVNILIGAIVKIIVNYIFIQRFGIMGAAVSSVLGIAVITLLNLYVLFKNIPDLVTQKYYGLRIIFSLLVMSILTFCWKSLLVELLPAYEINRLLAAIIALSTAIIGLFSYLLCLRRWPIWEESELDYLPSIIKRSGTLKKRREHNG